MLNQGIIGDQVLSLMFAPAIKAISMEEKRSGNGRLGCARARARVRAVRAVRVRMGVQVRALWRLRRPNSSPHPLPPPHSHQPQFGQSSCRTCASHTIKHTKKKEPKRSSRYNKFKPHITIPSPSPRSNLRQLRPRRAAALNPVGINPNKRHYVTLCM